MSLKAKSSIKEEIKNQSPNEVRLFGWVCFFFLFLNSGELFEHRVDFEDVFEYSDSVIFSIIDNHIRLRSSGNHIVFWLTGCFYFILMNVYAKKISKWLWSGE